MYSKFYLLTVALFFLATVNAFKLPVISDLIDKIKGNKDVKALDIPQKGGIYDLEIAANSKFTINIAGNPTTGYQWYLDNSDELNKKVVELVDQDYKTKGKKGVMGAGGTFIFDFKAKDVCSEALPTLNFVYKRSWEKDLPISNAQITLKVADDACPKKKVEEVVNADDKEIIVKVNEPFVVELRGNPTTGYSWTFENFEEVKATNVFTNFEERYNPDPHEEGLVGSGGTFVFEFEVNEEACGKELPTLNFVYKRSWETKNPADTASYTLKFAEGTCDEFSDKDEGEQDASDVSSVVEVKEGQEFTLKLKGNATTGYSWLVKNEDELLAAGIKKITEDYIQDEHEEGMVGFGGTFVFTFKAEGVCDKELPKIALVYRQPWMEEDPSDQKAEYALELNQESCAATGNAVATVKEITLANSATQGEIKANSGDVISIKIKGNPTTGYNWYLLNEEELVAAGIEPLNLTGSKSGAYSSNAPKGLVGAGGIFDFQFKVNYVKEDLPTIKFTYRRSWEPATINFQSLEVTIKQE